MKAKQDHHAAYWYLHTNGNLIKKRPLPGIRDDLNESDFVVKWWMVVNKNDMIIMLCDLKTNFIDSAKDMHGLIQFCNNTEIGWNITSADYFRHAVKVAAKEES